MKSGAAPRHIEILNIGVGTIHDVGHVSSQPGGVAYFVILCFRTPFLALTANGRETGLPGDCLVLEPGFPEWHTNRPGAERGFRNDWVHVGAAGMARLLKRYEIPRNRLIPSGNPMLLSDDLTAIRKERRYDFPLKHAAIDNYMESLLIKLSRAHMHRTELASYSRAEARCYPRFVEIREDVMGRATEKWTVERMARAANLGTNRFSALYRRFFGTSPVDDLLSARIELAKYHLASSNAKLQAIADTCGFSDVYYFSRLFRKRVGCPPGEYRVAPSHDAQGLRSSAAEGLPSVPP